MAIKKILVIPVEKKVEALRMAVGLTLLDDQVQVMVIDQLPLGSEAAEQMEALAFSDVPVTGLDGNYAVLAQQIIQSDVVYMV